jgi:cell division septum initiation protein DivIVA
MHEPQKWTVATFKAAEIRANKLERENRELKQRIHSLEQQIHHKQKQIVELRNGGMPEHQPTSDRSL